MATSSEVKAGLDDISQAIRSSRNALKNAKTAVTNAKSQLNSLPTAYSDVIAQITAYGAGTGSFEELAIAELAAMTTEFQALKTKATTAETDLAAIDFTL